MRTNKTKKMEVKTYPVILDCCVGCTNSDCHRSLGDLAKCPKVEKK